MLGPILFINKLFLFLNEINVCNFADDTTPFVCHKYLEELVKNFERNTELAIHWFEDSYMRLNTNKCHLLISDYKYEHQWDQIGKDMVREENEAKLLGITKENELKFDSHFLNICSKANENFKIFI